MRYDIVVVSYNSTKWLENCVKALGEMDYDLSQLHLIIVDNNSTDESPAIIQTLQEKYTSFGQFDLLRQSKNLGFGEGCNVGAAAGSAPYIFMLNVDTEIEPDALKEMDFAIEQDTEQLSGAFEMRQKPIEVGRHNDPVTMECAWNSGACVVYRREVFERVDGFDKNMFMYCEDVDLSWRIRALGYKLTYVPRAGVYHYTRRDDKNKEFHEYAWTAYNKLLMRYKYGDAASRRQGHKEYLYTLRHPLHFDHVRKVLLKNYIKHFFHTGPFRRWRRKNKDMFPKVPANFMLGFCVMRGLYGFVPLKETPLVSVIVRTCGRPQVLRLTLQSLRHQTYRNFEIIVQEDGPPTAQKMIEDEFADLNIKYEATGEKVGRSKSGNRALARSKGEYLNFLDDDDFFYPEHIELMLSTFEEHPDADFVVSGHMIYKQNTISVDPYVFEIKEREYHEPERMDILTMSKRDQIPILTCMFRRHLYTKMGGLREDIDTNEDWGMWLRFFTLKPVYYSNRRATCAFVFPHDSDETQAKLKSYRVNYQKVFDDEELVYTLTAKELNKIYNDYLADTRHLLNVGALHSFLNDHQAY